MPGGRPRAISLAGRLQTGPLIPSLLEPSSPGGRALHLDVAGGVGGGLPAPHQWWGQLKERVASQHARAARAAPPSAAGAAPMRLHTGARCLPHPEKQSYGGEDAFFVSRKNGGALGVADGVGGWAESNVNPAAYARALMRVACAYVEGARGDALARAAAEGAAAAGADSSRGEGEGEGGSEGGRESDGGAARGRAAAAAYAYAFSGGGSAGGAGGAAPAAAPPAAAPRPRGPDPRAALDAAHRRARCAGSATACVLQLDPARRRLLAANLGDSGFVVARKGAIVARSRPLQHWFDCPFQMGAYPEFVDATDTAANADIFEVPLQPGDVIVAGSDGLWDNAYDDDILALLPQGPSGAQAAADSIAGMARAHACDPEFPSPYTREALQQGYDLSLFEKLRRLTWRDGRVRLGRLTGGKLDDITVLVSVVDG
ncbi:MAG: phosphatase 2C-like domain-containing protein [Monoraphidium minutum]|nr:MAG: phosphatase 2C-like domain-containing protein [Monoraphidium minutum]